jgi:hypothetical protein
VNFATEKAFTQSRVISVAKFFVLKRQGIYLPKKRVSMVLELILFAFAQTVPLEGCSSQNFSE